MLAADVYNKRAMRQRDLDRAHFLKNFQSLILQYDHVVIFHHRGVDGDCLGAAFAMKEIIKANYPNKKAYVVGGSQSHAYDFMNMKFDNEINVDFDFGMAMALIVDVGQSDRIDAFDRFFRNDRFGFGAVVKIDHHDTVPDFHVDLAWDDPTYVSTCCQIIQLADYYGWFVPPRAATFLYLGCLTDSMNFSTVTVLPRTLVLAAKALRAGADAPFLNEQLRTRSWNHVQMMGHMITKAVRTNHVIYGIVTQEEAKKFGIDNVKRLISTYGNIEGLWIWMMAIEQPDGILDLSIRSMHVSAKDLALKYGGGGHEFAGGCKVHKSEFEALVHDANVMVSAAKRERARARALQGDDDVPPEIMERTREAVIRKNPAVMKEAKEMVETIKAEREAGEYDVNKAKEYFGEGMASDQKN